jgi:hypothetical protein
MPKTARAAGRVAARTAITALFAGPLIAPAGHVITATATGHGSQVVQAAHATTDGAPCVSCGGGA